MNITVFGGSGFMGSHLCDALTKAGHDVTIADIIQSPWLLPEQHMCTGDITDAAFVQKAIQNSEAVYNLAGIADIAEANTHPEDSARINILGNLNVLEACRKAQVKRYIFASSLYVHGISGGFYRVSKQACELYIEEYRRQYGLSCAIVRYGSLYGSRANTTNAIYRFISEALTTQEITYYGTPEAQREYIHVQDAATASLRFLDENFDDRPCTITGSQHLRISDLFRMMSEILGKELTIHYKHDPLSGHYEITPYAFRPQLECRLISPSSVDLGQGLLSIMHEVYEQNTANSVTL